MTQWELRTRITALRKPGALDRFAEQGVPATWCRSVTVLLEVIDDLDRQQAWRPSNPWHELYIDVKRCHGKANPAKAAVARKVLIAAWHVLARDEPFKPSAPRLSQSADAVLDNRTNLLYDEKGEKLALLAVLVRNPYGSSQPRPPGGSAPRLRVDPTIQWPRSSAHYQAEIAHLGIGRSPAFHYEPETNGVVEKFIQTLKEQVLWIEPFEHPRAAPRPHPPVRRPLRRALAARTPRLPHPTRSPRSALSARRGMIAAFTNEVSGEPGAAQKSPSSRVPFNTRR